MNRKQLIATNTLFVGLMLFSSITVYQYMTGNNPLKAFAGYMSPAEKVEVKTDRCSVKESNTKLDASRSRAMAALQLYQQACHSYVTDTVMVFMSMPRDVQTAKEYASKDADTLLEFNRSGIRPLVIAEPSDKDGQNLDFSLFADGTYNTVIDTYFSELKTRGLIDTQLGIWNPFPEANLPYWNNNEAKYFAPAVNNYVTVARQTFPGMQTSIMLNSATYSTTDFNWESGEYASLLQYIKGIQPGLINYAGLQGFPWLARSGGSGAILNGAEFLNPTLISEVADYLKVKDVWLNTGTFGTKYALDPSSTVTMSPERRSAVLATTLTQASLLQEQGYNVSINIFAKDKSKETEETDWSYWKNKKPLESGATPVITNFINQAYRQGLNFWLFDQQ